jgi:hypothetical protein
VEALFDSGPVWVVLPEVEHVERLRALLLLEAAEMEAELGGAIVVADDPPVDVPAMLICVDDSERVPKVIRESPSRLIATGRRWMRARLR